MEAEERVQDIIDTLNQYADPARKDKANTYCPTEMQVLGVATPHMRSVIRELKISYSRWPERNWIDLCKALVASGVFECQVMAYERIGRDRKLLAEISMEDLPALEKGLDNWASVDTYGVGIYGVLWRMGTVSDDALYRRLGSVDPWNRRLAVVSTVSLNLKSRGGEGDRKRTLEVCRRVVDDHHEMIQKALSWALRELSKRDRKAVREFMETYGNRLAGRVIREVYHKLDHGTKN